MSSGEETGPGATRNVEWAIETFRDFAERGPDAVIEILDPEVEIHSDQNLANAGTFHGVPGYRRWTERWFDAWEEFELEVQLIEPVGERHVVASCRQVARGRSSGVPVEMDAAYMFEVEAGRVIRFHLYDDRLRAIAVAREGEARPSGKSSAATARPAAD